MERGGSRGGRRWRRLRRGEGVLFVRQAQSRIKEGGTGML